MIDDGSTSELILYGPERIIAEKLPAAELIDQLNSLDQDNRALLLALDQALKTGRSGRRQWVMAVQLQIEASMIKGKLQQAPDLNPGQLTSALYRLVDAGLVAMQHNDGLAVLWTLTQTGEQLCQLIEAQIAG